MSVKTDLDELIDWYAVNKPDAGKSIPVRCTSSTVRKFAKRIRKGGGVCVSRAGDRADA